MSGGGSRQWNLTEVPAPAHVALITLSEICAELLGDSLRSVYAMGSIAFGSYENGWSDIDIDLILHERCDDAQLEILSRQVGAAVAAAGHSEIDLKYCRALSLAVPGGVEFGAMSHATLIHQTAKRLWGEDLRTVVPEPNLQHKRTDNALTAVRFLQRSPVWWSTCSLHNIASLLTFPARMLLNSATGELQGKTAALDYFLTTYSAQLPARCWPWVVWARAVRSIPAARLLPAAAEPAARQAARELLEWVVPLLQRAAAE